MPSFSTLLAILPLTLVTVSAQQCYVTGSCQDGSLLGSLNDIDNAAECLLECQDVPSCEGFTWDSRTKYCILFDSCTTIEMGTSCTDCVSGERACPVCDLEERICDEPIIQRGVAEDKTDCEILCTENQACIYYTFDEAQQTPPLNCIEFARCSTVSYCSTCTTGQRGCTEFVTTTTTFTTTTTTTTEISTTDTNREKQCFELDVINRARHSAIISLGFCKEGTLVLGATEETTNDCLDSCKSSPYCNWFSYDHSNGFCGLFSDCPHLDPEGCLQCLSGEATCDSMQCNVEGQCVGTFQYQTTAQTHLDCQIACVEFNSLCQFYTYNPDALLCLMFSDCYYFSEEVCQNCVSGEPTCILENEI